MDQKGGVKFTSFMRFKNGLWKFLSDNYIIHPIAGFVKGFFKKFLSDIDKLHKSWYNIYAACSVLTVASPGTERRGSEMDVMTFVMSVLASVVANCISKLMDKHN